ncbi:interferon regulatory factor 9 [Erpetoichthys calabaricus]|uniref:IRF tryptophan pentad repeat domain-containing protein n=1 Tax=Erpetoichthys calabaricus TaxID=27687 RepID=A0A8C4XAZ9_ERPCA|nr:interferon regulatory factor 9 [Erpetoichthys calabaricus]XP_028649547.1 interferon regulatory factor 9 [Erpetoichthys calabaricus]
MASGRIRSTRKLKQWMVEQVNSNQYPGLVWDDQNNSMFRIPWKHAGKQDFRSEEDAAIFKAWAKFKGKLKDGEKADPATWKTRLRCALNKSPEFEEVPDRSQLDISEPYKVYRIVPLSEQGRLVCSDKNKESSNKRKRKQSDSESETDEESPVKKLKEESLVVVEPIGQVSSSDSQGTEAAVISKEQYQTSLNEIHLNLKIETMPAVSLQPTVLPSMIITIFYAGKQVDQQKVDGPDVKIAARDSNSVGSSSIHCGMQRIWLPSEDCVTDSTKKAALSRLMTFLDRGIMLASNSNGLYAQRSCQGRVFWSGPCAPYSDQPNKLERLNSPVQLFDRKKFVQDLMLYRTSGGELPQHKITLCLGEEFPESDPNADKLVKIEVEQPWARQQLEEATGFRESLCLLQELASQSPLGEVTLNLYGFNPTLEL